MHTFHILAQRDHVQVVSWIWQAAVSLVQGMRLLCCKLMSSCISCWERRLLTVYR